MVRFTVLIGIGVAGCLPDSSAIDALEPVCTERPAPWNDTDWVALLAEDNSAALLRFEADARCASFRARTAVLATVTASDDAKAAAALMAIEPVNDLAGLLMGALSASRFDCDCGTPRCVASSDSSAVGLTELCGASTRNAEVVESIAMQAQHHSGYAVEATTSSMRSAHSEHVLNCLQTGSSLDWDGDGEVGNPCVEYVDFGTTGGVSSNLITMIKAHWTADD
jgi:hypothetical protein